MLIGTKYLVIFLMMLSCSVVVFSQIGVSTNFEESCYTETTYVKDYVYSYTSDTVTLKNGTKTAGLVPYMNVSQKPVYITKCVPILLIKDKPIDYAIQGYACGITDGVIVCDSKIDGNGDGKCYDGETCCRVINDVIECKNSHDWKADDIPIKRLAG